MIHSLYDFDEGLIGEVDDLARAIDEALDQLKQIDQDYGLTERMEVVRVDLRRAYDLICTDANDMEDAYNGL